MGNLSAVLLTRVREQDPRGSVLDLTAYYRGSK
jgi:hypothetical protein